MYCKCLIICCILPLLQMSENLHFHLFCVHSFFSIFCSDVATVARILRRHCSLIFSRGAASIRLALYAERWPKTEEAGRPQTESAPP